MTLLSGNPKTKIRVKIVEGTEKDQDKIGLIGTIIGWKDYVVWVQEYIGSPKVPDPRKRAIILLDNGQEICFKGLWWTPLEGCYWCGSKNYIYQPATNDFKCKDCRGKFRKPLVR